MPPGDDLTQGGNAPAPARLPSTVSVKSATTFPQDGRIEAVNLMLFFMDREGERYWQRNAVFVSIITALYGVFLLKLGEFSSFQCIIVGLFGVVTSKAWLEVLSISKFYAERWRQDACAYVKSHSDLSDILHTVCGEPLVDRPSGPGSSAVMKRLARISEATWYCVLLYGAAAAVLPICKWATLFPQLGGICSR
jgi:hypothetical protein